MRKKPVSIQAEEEDPEEDEDADLLTSPSNAHAASSTPKPANGQQADQPRAAQEPASEAGRPLPPLSAAALPPALLPALVGRAAASPESHAPPQLPPVHGPTARSPTNQDTEGM